MNFEFATATRIVFGRGKLAEVGEIAAGLGHRPLVVMRSNADPLLEILDENEIEYASFVVQGEPTIDTAQAGVKAAKEANCDLVIGFGGGSVIDAAKAIAALATNPGDPLDYLEVIGKGNPLQHDPLPFIAIPTTAGTGSEVSKNAVLASPQHRVKVSLRHNKMLAAVALVDPELTLSVPPAITASTGMDALTQVLEPYVTHLANPLVDSLCREGLHRAARSLLSAYENGGDIEAREDIAITSLFGGLALANAKLGAVHGFAGPLGGMFKAPHGAICAALLPDVMEVNIRALQERDPEGDSLLRYDEIAAVLTGDWEAAALDGADWVRELGEALKIPSLGTYGIQEKDIPSIIEKSSRSSSMKGNPIALTYAEMKEILTRAL